jgi:hypothetical protein
MIPTLAAAYGLYPRHVALPDVVRALNNAGYGNANICMVLSPAHPHAAAVAGGSILEGLEETAISTRVIEWFSALGAVIIPTICFFVRSQTFLQAVVNDQNVPSLSGGSRTLIGLGFSQDDAKRLGHQLTDVGALIYVSCGEDAKADGAIELLRSTGASEAASLNLIKASAAVA